MPGEIRVPQMGESVTEATVARWLKKEGEAIGPEAAVVTLETDKVEQEIAPEESGVLERIVAAEGTTVHVGDLLAIVAVGAKAGATSNGAAPASATSSGAPQTSGLSSAVTPNGTSAVLSPGSSIPAATPVARRIAAEQHVDLSRVTGSGPSGRVTKDDVAAYLDQSKVPSPAAPPPMTAPSSAPAAPAAPSPLEALFPSQNRVERIRMSKRRQTIATRLVEAQHTAAMLTTFNEIDMSAVMEVRKRRRDSFKERHGIGLGFMSFFTKAAVGALKAFPRLNAEIQGNEIVLKHYYDIGVAVGAEEGLIVPVLRDADRKSFAEIEREIAALAARARENKLTLAELQGGTFTITNGGVFGSLLSTPILNAPEVGILGLHKIEERPIALKGEVVIRPMMYVALTYDHRIVDGREAVQFLVRIKELIEDPETLLLEG